MNVHPRLAHLGSLMTLLALSSCGGGGGGGSSDGGTPPPPAAASCTVRAQEFIGVCSGFPDAGNLAWESTGGDGGGGVGDGGASGDGGVGAGGDFGQFRNVNISVYRLDTGALLGEAPTDSVKGMVTIRPGTYRGALRVELRGGANAEYYEEGKNRFVAFPADRVIRVIVPRIDKNIGITAFTEAAYQLLTQGSAAESVASTTPTAEQIRAANARVAAILNRQFPKALEVDDITRLPFIKSPTVGQGSITTDRRGIYGVVNGAFSKQAALFNTGSDTPTLDAVSQLSEDLRDGHLDGSNRGTGSAPAARRTYDPNTLAGELTAALAHQAERFGNQALKDTLPPILNFGGTRYEGYLFDTSVPKNRTAVSKPAGWLSGNTLNLTIGQGSPKELPLGQSVAGMISNFGHGGAFFKIDSTDTTAAPVYRVYALGDNVNGELGTGNQTETDRKLVEITLPGPLTHAAGGFAHTVLRLADGRVFTLGDNSFGQLGQGVDSATLQRTTTPVEVALPVAAGGAVAVAATSVASYALMADGTVYAWGSNGGFGLLGNGQANGTQTRPALLSGLNDVVQISARDNDVVVLKRDHSIWQWGSHPADVNAFTDGDLSSPYRGGTLLPTAVSGLPTTTVGGAQVPIAVRKIITEQGLFAALLDNGHVYNWGVHFDLSAKAVLRDLVARRVLGLPPLRDMMPGGFVGYGARPFDRLTAMGVDYSGGMWKIRGRVAERFDPENPSAQRRPQTGVPRSADCATCHTFLDESLETLRARQAAEAPVAPGAAVCVPPTAFHQAENGTSFIRAETECIQCHNPSRVNPAYAGQVRTAFTASGGWPNCNKPTNLPPRDTVAAAVITSSCSIPAGHVYTPPGTVCSSCHNSVVARALQDLNPPCAQPEASELPTLTTAALIAAIVDDGGATVASGSATRDASPELRGTLNAALGGSQTLAVYRNGTAVGNAAVSGTGWSYSDGTAPQGLASYFVRVMDGARFGPRSNVYSIRIDSVAPTAAVQVTGINDDGLGALANGAFGSDSTPTVIGTLAAALDAGEVVQVLRNGQPAGTASVSGSTWSYTEPQALAAGSYSYAARVVDVAANTGPTGSSYGFTLLNPLPGAAIARIADDSDTTIAAGALTRDGTPTLSGSVDSVLPAAATLRVLRNGTAVGTATVSGLTWAYTDTAGQGVVSYTVRAEAGAVLGTSSAAYAIEVDSIAPTQQADVGQIADDYIGALPAGGTTADATPTVSGTLSATLGAGEQLRLLRTLSGGSAVEVARLSPSGTTWSYTEASLLAAGSYSYQAQVVDAAGNSGTLGTARAITIDLTAIPLPGSAVTLATVNGVTPSGGAIPVSNNGTPVLAGTLQRALNANEVVRVYRNGTGVGNATVSGTAWSYTNTQLADGTYAFQARVELSGNSGVFGPGSSSVNVPIDTTAPVAVAAVTVVSDSFSGALADGGNTADTTPTLSGTLSATPGTGETLQLLRNGTVVATPTASGLAWSYTDTVTAGTYVYTARVVDAVGNASAAGGTRSVTVVTNLPTVSTLAVTANGSSLAAGGSTNDARPIVTATLGTSLPAGQLLRVFRDGTSIGTATGCASSCTVTDPGAADGAHAYTARTEAGSALGTLSSTFSLTVDTTAPATVAAVTLISDDFVGALADGATSADQTPAVTGTLSATLAPGEQLVVSRSIFGSNAWAVVGQPTPAGTAWSYVEQAALPSPAQYAYRAQVRDAAGNTAAAGATRSVLVDTSAIPLPNAATTLSTVNGVAPVNGVATASNDNTPTLAGTIQRALNSGEVVRVYRSGVAVGNATVSTTSWTYTDSARADGSPTYSARIEVATNAAAFGQPSATITVPIDTVAPTQTASVTQLSDSVIGNLADGGATADTTPTITGTLSAALGSGETLQLLRNGSVVSTVVPTGLAWTYTDTVAAGTYAYSARVIDAASNTSGAGTTRSVVVVDNLPGATVASVAYSGSGLPQANGTVVASGGTIADPTPTINVTLGATLPSGYLVRVLRDGSSIGTATGCGTACAVTDVGASDGAHVYTARTEFDTARGSTSASYTVTVDTTAPAPVAAVTLIADDFIGALPAGGSTSDFTPTASGTLTAALGSGEQLRVLRALGAAAAVEVTRFTPAGTTWTYTEPGVLSPGSYTYSAQVIDAVGNGGTIGATRTVTLDATAVPLPGAAVVISTVNGVAPTANAVPSNSNALPVLAGTVGRTVAGDEVIRVYRLGAPVGTATVSGLTWSYTNTTLVDGTYTFAARVEKASNATVFGLVSSTVSVPIDTTAPTQVATISGIFDDNSISVGANNTADSTPRISGTLNVALGSGESLRLERAGPSGTTVLSPTVSGGTTWTLTEASALPAGSYTYTAVVQDTAGNRGPLRTQTVTVIAALSSTAISQVEYSAGLASPRADGTAVGSGSPIADATPTVRGTIGATLPNASTFVRVYRGGVLAGTATVSGTGWTFVDASVGEGNRTYTARLENGTAYGSTSGSYSVTVDTVAPSAPGVTLRANDRPYENQATPVSGSVAITSGATTGEVDPLVNVTFAALPAGERIRVFRNGVQIGADYTTAGGTTYAVQDSTRLNRPPSAPSGTVTSTTGLASSYTVKQIDAAGNESVVGAGSTFSITMNYVDCSQSRATSVQSAALNPTHGANWATTTAATCRGCHVGPVGTAVATGLIPAPGSGTTTTSYYWCRKAE